MKKLILVWVLAVLGFQPAVADTPATGLQAAVAAGIYGDVQIARADYAPADRSIGRQLGSGAPIYMGDEIVTGPNSGLQIMLLDQTIITLGQNSRMAIDEMVYDPNSGTGKIAVDVKDGAFRFTSGKIAQASPDSVSVKVPLASVGIRGTIFGGAPQPGGSSKDGYFVMLMGPGPANNTAAKVGAVGVTSNGATQEISRPGNVVDLAPNQSPSPAHMASPEQQQTMSKVSSSVGPQQQQQQQQQQRQGQAQQPGAASSSAAAASSQSSSPSPSPIVVGGPSAGDSAGLGGAAVMTAVSTQQIQQSQSTVNVAALVSTGQQVATATSSISTAMTEVVYSVDGHAYYNSISAYSPTSGAITSLTDADGVPMAHSGGTSTSVLSDGTVALDQWVGGSRVITYDGDYAETDSLGSGALNFVGGTITLLTALPTTGSATYTVLASSTPTFTNGSTGTFNSASLTVAFGNSPTVSYSVAVTMSDSTTYTLSSSSVSLGNGTKALFSSTATTTTSGGTNLACSSSCTGYVTGALFGSAGQRAGMAYGITANSATYNLTGAVALKKN